MMVDIQEGVSWTEWTDLARAAEAAGLDGLFSGDHYMPFHTDRGGGFDVWTTLAALAAVTERIRLGTLMSSITFRHPSLLARMAATVDHISGGRLEAGIGAGWLEGEHLRFGSRFPVSLSASTIWSNRSKSSCVHGRMTSGTIRGHATGSRV